MKEMLDKQAVLNAIADEPEYPGEAPPVLVDSIGQMLRKFGPKQTYLWIARMACNQTKRCIAERINKLDVIERTDNENKT